MILSRSTFPLLGCIQISHIKCRSTYILYHIGQLDILTTFTITSLAADTLKNVILTINRRDFVSSLQKSCYKSTNKLYKPVHKFSTNCFHTASSRLVDLDNLQQS